MNLAYLISAYRLPHQLVRLIDRLDAPGTSFFIHVDARTDERVADAIMDALADRPNTTFVCRHPAAWGSFGHVAGTLEAIDAALGSGTPFDYAILLTGQDYPIKPNREIRRFFEAAEGRPYLEFFPLPHPEWEHEGLNRFEQWHWRANRRHLALPPRRMPVFRRRLPAGLRPFGGSSYWNLPRACVEYVHSFVRRHPEYVRFFRRVDVPDELFFQTILLNSSFAEQAVNDNLRYIDWGDGTGGSPLVLGTRDLPRLAASTALFARKFDATVDAEVLDRIDAELLAGD